MGLIEVASGKSVWRGMDYYENHKVVSWKKTGNTTYEGIVEGGSGKIYSVTIDTNHPKKSTCTCPFAAGRRVVCKHMIALYFTAEPWAAEYFMRKVEKYEKEAEEEQMLYYQNLRKYVNSLTKEELQDQLYDALIQLEEKRRYDW